MKVNIYPNDWLQYFTKDDYNYSVERIKTNSNGSWMRRDVAHDFKRANKRKGENAKYKKIKITKKENDRGYVFVSYECYFEKFTIDVTMEQILEILKDVPTFCLAYHDNDEFTIIDYDYGES